MNQQRHLIGRTVLELDTGNLADVWSLQEEASRVFQQQAIPEMERLFDHLIATDQVVRFDQVVIEIGIVDRHFFADELIAKLRAALSQILSDTLQDRSDQGLNQSKQPSLVRQDRSRADWEVLLYFLEYGRLPWWAIALNWQSWVSRWEATIQSSSNWHSPLQALLSANIAAQQRLIEQFAESFCRQLIVQIQPEWNDWFTLLAQARSLMRTLELSDRTMRSLEQQAWRSLLSEIVPGQSSMPLPTATWMRHWLEHLTETYLEEVAASDVLENRPDVAYQRLQASLASVPAAQRSLWLTALAQIVPTVEIPALRSDLEIWLYFLQQGRLPIAQPARSWQDWLSRWQAVMQSEAEWRQALQAVLSTNPTAQRRLIEQFPESFRQQLITQIDASPEPEQAFWLALIDLLQTPAQIESENTNLNQDGLLQSPNFESPNFGESRIQSSLELEDLESESSANSSDSVMDDLQVWLYFLEQGRLPIKYAAQDWLSRWEAVIQSNTNWRQSLQALLSTHSTARQRLIEQFPESFRQQLIIQMQSFLETASPSERSFWLTLIDQPIEASEHSDLEIWLYFLQQGRLPIKQPTRPWQDWLSRWEKMLQEADWQQALQAVLSTNPTAQQRLIEQFPESFRQQLITQIDALPKPESEQAFWLALIDLLQTPAQIESENTDLNQDRLPQSPNLGEVRIQNTPELQDLASESLANSSDSVMDDLQVWLYFLEQGHLPIAQSAQDWLSRWEIVMQSNTNWRQSLQALLSTHSTARQRLIEQFPESFRQQLIIQMQPLWIGWYSLLAQARHWMQTMPFSSNAIQHLETQAWLLLLSELISSHESPRPFPTATWLHHWLTQVARIAKDVPDSIALLRTTLETTAIDDLALWRTEFDRAIRANRRTALSSLRLDRASSLLPEEAASGLYITQAGLVLLHPFLSFYFDAVGLLDGDSFRDRTAQQFAVYLLHYLATQQTDAPEYELVFPKLLCGWALDEPIARGLELPIAALHEGEHLLQTVINYWEVLKSTTPDGLREGFLQRQGKLTRSNEGTWKLQVEQSAIDVLLSSLPWGLSMVKLPWSEDRLIVEWH